MGLIRIQSLFNIICYTTLIGALILTVPYSRGAFDADDKDLARQLFEASLDSSTHDNRSRPIRGLASAKKENTIDHEEDLSQIGIRKRATALPKKTKGLGEKKQPGTNSGGKPRSQIMNCIKPPKQTEEPPSAATVVRSEPMRPMLSFQDCELKRASSYRAAAEYNSAVDALILSMPLLKQSVIVDGYASCGGVTQSLLSHGYNKLTSITRDEHTARHLYASVVARNRYSSVCVVPSAADLGNVYGNVTDAEYVDAFVFHGGGMREVPEYDVCSTLLKYLRGTRPGGVLYFGYVDSCATLREMVSCVRFGEAAQFVESYTVSREDFLYRNQYPAGNFWDMTMRYFTSPGVLIRRNRKLLGYKRLAHILHRMAPKRAAHKKRFEMPSSEESQNNDKSLCLSEFSMFSVVHETGLAVRGYPMKVSPMLELLGTSCCTLADLLVRKKTCVAGGPDVAILQEIQNCPNIVDPPASISSSSSDEVTSADVSDKHCSDILKSTVEKMCKCNLNGHSCQNPLFDVSLKEVGTNKKIKESLVRAAFMERVRANDEEFLRKYEREKFTGKG